MEACLQNPHRIQFRVDTLAVQDGKALKALKPDEHGYFIGIPLAGLGFPTRNKTYYDIDSFTKCINSPQSAFYKRLTSGQLYGERGHPNVIGMNPQDATKRMLNIDEGNLAVHLRSVYTDPNLLPNGGRLILGDVKPFGIAKNEVQENFECPYTNTAFSLRSITESKPHNGLSYRYMKNLITFDWVAAGGYHEASKRYSTANESFEEFCIEINTEAIVTNEISIENLENTLLNDVLGTNKVLQVSERKTFIIPDPKQRINRYTSGLTDKSIRKLIGRL